MHFSHSETEGLIIRTKKDGAVHELLRQECFFMDFPETFGYDYFHWVNISTGVVEWRPNEHPWTSTEENWHLVEDGDKRWMQRGSARMVDTSSRTARVIHYTLHPIEAQKHIHIEFDTVTKRLTARLPRLKLEFFDTPEGFLTSKQFRGMVVDENQSLGTFTGLINKLVLTSDNRSKPSRAVIVPHGTVRFTPSEQNFHVQVWIGTMGQKTVP